MRRARGAGSACSDDEQRAAVDEELVGAGDDTRGAGKRQRAGQLKRCARTGVSQAAQMLTTDEQRDDRACDTGRDDGRRSRELGRDQQEWRSHGEPCDRVDDEPEAVAREPACPAEHAPDEIGHAVGDNAGDEHRRHRVVAVEEPLGQRAPAENREDCRPDDEHQRERPDGSQDRANLLAACETVGDCTRRRLLDGTEEHDRDQEHRPPEDGDLPVGRGAERARGDDVEGVRQDAGDEIAAGRSHAPPSAAPRTLGAEERPFRRATVASVDRTTTSTK